MSSRSWRGRGGRHGRGGLHPTSTPYERPQTPPPPPVPGDLGLKVSSLNTDHIETKTSDSWKIRNATCVATYNWANSVDSPRMLFPGADQTTCGPPRWTPLNPGPQLYQDNGTVFYDLNAAFCPVYPFHPLALAVFASGNISTNEVDLVACASSLWSLYEFAARKRKTFRIMVELVGNTVFFIRRDHAPREAIPNVRGYGHTMPEAYTTWEEDVEGSVSHQRVVQYNFDGNKCMVRYESDGYLPEELPSTRAGAVSPGSSTDDSSLSDSHNDDDTAMSTASVSGPTIPQDCNTASFKITNAGESIPQSATFELKTRAIRRQQDNLMREFLPRLWLTQTPHLIIGYHQNGRFERPSPRDVRSEVTNWEGMHQWEITRFVWLLEWIMNTVRRWPEGRLELWRHEKEDLEVRMCDSEEVTGALPDDVKERWANSS